MAQFLYSIGLRVISSAPVFIVTMGAVGATYGSYDLSRKVANVLLPSLKHPPRPFSQALSFAAAIGAAYGALSLRKQYLAPAVAPPPKLPYDSSVPYIERARNLRIITMHVLKNYPYAFKFSSALVGGCVAGVTYTLTNWGYNYRADKRSMITESKEEKVDKVEVSTTPEQSTEQAPEQQ